MRVLRSKGVTVRAVGNQWKQSKTLSEDVAIMAIVRERVQRLIGVVLDDPGGGPRGLRGGFFQEGPFEPVDRQIQEVVSKAAATLEEMGCVVEPVEFDWKERLAIDVCMSMVVGEGEHYLRPYVSGRMDELTEQIQGLLGLPLPPLEDFLVSMDKRDLLAQDMAQFFDKCDLLLCPTSPTLAHGHEAETLFIEGQEVGPGHAANITATFGMTGSPAISVPFSMSEEGLPIGVQLVAGHYDESTLLQVAAALEEAGEQGHPPI